LKKKVIGLIDSDSGNIGSIKKAILKSIVRKPYKLKIIRTKKDFINVDKIILPGQGAFATLINSLKKKKLYNELLKSITDLSLPYLGICVGMQILASYGHENKKIRGMNIIKGDIVKFSKKKLTIPHMGWNSISIKKENKVFKKKDLHLKDFYFVHSYYFKGVKKEDVTATTNYSINYPSIISKNNIYGVQFHPEKSHKIGFKIINNFILKS
tara:strand:- start:1228 stop:1863 length:636 start_codon:yes stop_codon:yes gene_type:complete